MSDMSRPRPLPPAAGHEQHDALLVAQLAVDDPLEPHRHDEARRLVATCGACAELAADLRAVSGAVAWEPVPPRRRDFRLTVEQAEQLQGNAVTRTLRRLSLPRSRVFRPAAAGIMTVGLAFMVAGYAWPDSDITLTRGDDAVAPASVEEAPSAPMQQEAGSIELERPLEEGLRAPTRETNGAGAELDDVAADAESGAAGLEAFAADEDAAAAVPEPGAAEPDAAAKAQPERALRSEAAEAGVATETEGRIVAEPPAIAGGRLGPAGIEAVAEASSDEREIEALLLVVGLAMVLGGGSALLLGWLVRRASDPLLR